MIYYVSNSGNDSNTGSKKDPFKTINHAAQLAVAGDVVRVHGGVYREWVNPKNGGCSEDCRIVYEAVEGELPIIKGSEIITDWEHVEGTVWKKVLSNEMFGSFNPYQAKLEGDWLESPSGKLHLGDVYINGTSMYEAHTYADMLRAEKRVVWEQNGFKYKTETVMNPENTVYQWYAEVNSENTTVWCNFGEIDPNTVTIEINVRQSCFYPSKAGVNYITLRGFEISQAACPFTPPTSNQIGMVGANWSKGWIIENNRLHDAKCSAISIGKNADTGDNLSSRFGRKSGHRYQSEAVFLALRSGWNKDTVGSHIIRNNVIYDCGQNGIVGHMGCAFCVIEHNEIYNIAMKREFWGHEIGGIKFHAPIDTVIKNNNIHHCMLGTWLDWQSQGTRLTQNIYHHNDRDLMIEVTHGPCTVDHNILLSDFALDNHAQGSAFVHNLIAGVMRMLKVPDRATPYHFPHTTEVAGYLPVYGGDDRVYNNLFIGKETGRGAPDPVGNFGSTYDSFHTPKEYEERLQEEKGHWHRLGFYSQTAQPVWIEGNAYSGHAYPFRAETSATIASGMTADIKEQNGEWILTVQIPEAIANAACEPVTTERLGTPRITEEPYENPDGTPLDFTTDFFGERRVKSVVAGPFATLTPGKHEITVWKKNQI